MHFYLDYAVALAGFAASALDVEGESSWTVALCLGFVGGSEKLANIVEHAGVGRRIAARSPSDWGLVYHNHLIQVFHAQHVGELSGARPGAVELPDQVLVYDLVDKGAFSAAGNSGHAGEHA